jgi:predicted dehydrogenase
MADMTGLRDGAAGVVDWAQVVLGHDRDGVQRRVTLHVTRLAAWASPRFELHGTAGSWCSDGLDTQEDQLKAGMVPGAAGWGHDPRPARLTIGTDTADVSRPRGDYRRYYLGIRDALRGQGPNPVPATEALRVMAVMDCAMRSAAEGRTLRFDPT